MATDVKRPTLADIAVESDVVRSPEREEALAWIGTRGRDVARGVREATRARWLGPMADVLDQRLAWPRFKLALDDGVPERAAAIAEFNSRGPDHPAEVRLRDLRERARSDERDVRATALRELADEHESLMATELGRGLAKFASDATLDAQIERLRAALDVDRMIAALDVRSWPESTAERDERVIREALADKATLLAEPETNVTVALWGGVGGRAMRVISAAGRERLLTASHEMRERWRARRRR